MKKISVYRKLLVLLTCIWLCGCTTNLDRLPLDFLEEQQSFVTENDALLALNGVYDQLRGSNYYGLGWLILSTVNADDGSVQTVANANLVEIDHNTFTAANNYFDNFYVAAFQMIDRANRVIYNVPTMDFNPTLQRQIVGEAKFLRALGYFDLVRAFGDVPLVTEPAKDIINVRIERTNKDLVYQQIVQDLLDAEEVLPINYTAANQIGRATSGAAKSLLAKVYLTLKDWSGAAQKSKEVIDSGTYTLFPDYKDVFDPTNNNGMEHIFSIQYSCIQLRYGSSFSKNFAIHFSYPFGGGGVFQTNDFFADAFPDDDYRKEITVITEKLMPDGSIVESRTGPHTDKYWDPAPCGDNYNRNNFMVIRYADVLLMYAEAENEINGATDAAYDAINQVRARARNGNPQAVPQDLSGLSQAEFREAVAQERLWELSFEGHRRWDLLRTGQYLTVMRAAGIAAEEHHLLYPIPQNEIDVNPELIQNPGY